MVGTSASSPEGIKPVDVASQDGIDDGLADDWMVGDTSEWEAVNLGDTDESIEAQAGEPGRDTIPSPPPEPGADVTPITIPAPPPIGDFDCSG